MDKETFVMKIANIKEDNESLYNDYLLKKIREEVYVFLLQRKDEDEYYDFFGKSETEKELMKVLCKEIEDAGWKCKFGFGSSALFIFRNEVPRTCWAD